MDTVTPLFQLCPDFQQSARFASTLSPREKDRSHDQPHENDKTAQEFDRHCQVVAIDLSL
ncbi:hypothetical protein [Celeribacter sp. PS-C1]|uniref:hypothetical protein n=1 Tax=Celeribacter sp. PS-C1 TaxID=2820813 RepID=UPI001CA4DFAE|nr:hypothetical protein [Celeribacter sp. PS-C1]MBW6419730.1 hypothetical protein [Celeribacter sp. PS-C1]